MKTILTLFLSLTFASHLIADLSLTAPIAPPDLVFEEKDGFVSVEAEHFFKQELADVRAWYLTSSEAQPAIDPDADPNHVAGTGGGAYLEILPDTRKNHGEKLINGENFVNEPGKMAVLSYQVHFHTPGKYFVWARTHSTGTEDNGLHVGIDGSWPESGQRMQWTGKNKWVWGSKQRTEKVHTGVPGILFLEVAEPGEHTIQFSMREDGFEFDAWIMTTDPEYKAPDGPAPASAVKSGTAPEPFPAPALNPAPAPTAQSRALGHGDFSERSNLYLDKGKWLAINPDQNREATASGNWPFRSGVFNLTFHAVGENDGESTYQFFVDGEKAGEFVCPVADDVTAEGEKFTAQFKELRIEEGARIEVKSAIGSKDGEEFSRARWSRIDVAASDGEPVGARKHGSAPPPVVVDNASGNAFKGELYGERGVDGDSSVEISGELAPWHKVTLTFAGPFAHEKDNRPNPFTDYQFDVTFAHEAGKLTYRVPGYFAADGDAGNSSAESGNKWRAHLSPDLPGKWTYRISFQNAEGKPMKTFDAIDGGFEIADLSDDSDPRNRGRLQYVENHHLRFAGSGDYFIKAGADAPETFLGYADFDGTVAGNPKKVPLKTWAPHVRDWKEGDPTWKGGKGKGMIGAINYLAGKGCNVFSFLPYNAGGDGDNVWPFVSRNDKFHYDCSKLDQWGTVFDHGTDKGMFLHFKLQETENDDKIPESLDRGDLGPERKLYLRELIARFGHNLALNWNLGEENTQSTKQQKEMAQFIADTDPYDHLIVVHTFPDQQDKVYRPLLGDASVLRGASLQNSNVKDCHSQIVKWTRESSEKGKPWVVSFDEPGTASEGMPPDPSYPGTPKNFDNPSIHTVRKQVLWGTLLGGGGGVEYYFGYKLPQNDLVCEDWRSRDQSWDYCRIALEFFRDNKIPIGEMANADELVGNSKHDNSRYCYAKEGEIYLVYLPEGGETELDLSGATAEFTVSWFNPREGGALKEDEKVKGGGTVKLTAPDGKDDWLAVVR